MGAKKTLEFTSKMWARYCPNYNVVSYCKDSMVTGFDFERIRNMSPGTTINYQIK